MIIGHHRQIQYLKKVLEKGTLAHAYLFYGPDSVGKKAVALECVKALFCQGKSGIFGGCSACPSCEETAALAHPDLTLLSPDRPLIQGEKSGIGIPRLSAGIPAAKGGLGIASVQELERRLGLSAWAGGWRAVIIDRAESLSFEAQAALLKILEEPGPKTVFFLIAASAKALLATIRSRCVPMHFSLVGDEVVGKELIRLGLGGQMEERIRKLSAGRPGLALRLAYNQELLDHEEKKAGFYQKLLGANLDEQFRFSDGAGRDSEELKAFFEFCLRTLASSLFGQLKSFETALPILKAAVKSYELLELTTVNRRLLADAFFVELAMTKAKL